MSDNKHYLAMIGAMKELMEWGRTFEKRDPWVSPYEILEPPCPPPVCTSDNPNTRTSPTG